MRAALRSHVNRGPQATCRPTTVHVVEDMNIAAPSRDLHVTDDPHEKTIDLRLQRLAELTKLSRTVAERHMPMDDDYIARALTGLIENKTLVAAHARTLIEQIVASLPDLEQQDDAIQQTVRPLTEAVERANVAIVRLRHMLGGRG